jgi:diguanylate cyclase (GGDEF)-like protein/PAS domain S-box-containing protein
VIILGTVTVALSWTLRPGAAVMAAVVAVLLVLLLVHLRSLNRALESSNRLLTQTARFQGAMADAAISLGRASDLESVAQVTVRTAMALDDTVSWSAFAVSQPPGPTVIASAGPAPEGAGQLAGDGLDPGWDDDRVDAAPARATGAAGGALPCSGHLVVPVRVDDHLRGSLVIGHRAAPTDSLRTALHSLCVNAGLALQTAEAVAEQLQRSERRFRSLVQNSSDAVTLLSGEGVAIYQSDSGRAVLGRESGAVLGQTFAHLTHPDDADYSRAQFIKVVSGGPGGRVTYEGRFLHADGSWRQLEVVMTNLLDDPDVGAIVSNSRDVTDRRALEQQLSHQAFHDSLTGLANRELFLDRVAHALDRADRGTTPVAVMFVDIDDFKMVNDSLGHHLGDEVLVAIAERLKRSTRPGDTVARLGGDEFALLLESGEMPEAAEAVAARIAADLLEPVRVGTGDLSVRASIGIALDRPFADGPDALLRDADLAMYLAKHNGKGRFEMFHPDMHDEAVRRLELTAELRHAIEDRQLQLFYQPIIDVGTTATIGAEALVRWHHPVRGLVSPAEFIPVAESTGLIVPLGRWVLGEACRQVESWRRSDVVDRAFTISVNLSGRQLQEPSILDDVTEALRSSGLPAAAVVLEVTESMIMDNVDAALDRLNALKELGLRLAVDDFGTGYSSLSYLRNFPMDIIKIDKSFVDRIAVDAEGVAMVRGVIDLSGALGLTTIAEGVESGRQLQLLSELGCDSAQGHLFASPIPAEEFGASFGAHRTEAAWLAHG